MPPLSRQHPDGPCDPDLTPAAGYADRTRTTSGPAAGRVRGLAEQVVQRPARRPKNRKAQIAMAAARLFCERGYHGVGVDEIAEAVGISGPAVYRHFPNKYAVLVHATRELVDAVRTAADDGLDATGTPRERIDRLLAGLARLAVERRDVG